MKLSIGAKLLILFAIMMFMFLGFSLYARGDFNEFYNDITSYKEIQEEVMAAKELQLSVLNVWQFITDASLTRDRSVIDEEAKPNIEDAKKLTEYLIRLNQDEPKHLKISNGIRVSLDEMWQVGNRMFNAYSEDWEKGNLEMDEYDRVSDKTIGQITVIVQEMGKEADEAIEEMYSMIKKSLMVITVVLALGAIINTGIFLFIRALRKNITSPLKGLAEATSAVAEGDLTIEVEGKDIRNEIGDLAKNFSAMINGLKSVLSQIKDGTDNLASASEELSSSSSVISDGSEEQTSRASQVATASQEMSSTIIDVAKNAADAAEAARTATQAAISGGEIVAKSIDSINSVAKTTGETARVIESLGNRSQEVDNIIRVIDDIASQTNLLALNAAIEAARAGEQGRGFSVVADEVRKLAEKTTGATKEISNTIKVIKEETEMALSSMESEVEAVEEGVQLTQKTGAALEEIVLQVEQVSSMMAQIATASEEQSTASDQISMDIENVAEITVKNASGAREIADASMNIAEVASNLQKVASVFKVSRDEVGADFNAGSDVVYDIRRDNARVS